VDRVLTAHLGRVDARPGLWELQLVAVPMRILHISTRLILGGSQENTVLSCEGQARRGDEVHLAYGPIYGPEGSMLDRAREFRTSAGAPITLHEIPDLVREVRPLRDRRAYLQLRSLIDRVGPDIVHTHSSKAGILGRLAAWHARGPGGAARPAIVHTIHGPPFMPVEGGPLASLKIRLANAAFAAAERHAARRCDLIVSVADAMTERFRALAIGTSEQYMTVRSGMETDPFTKPDPHTSRDQLRAELGLDPDDFVIGTIARLAQHKGHDDLLDAVADDLRNNPDWKLLWVGDGWWRNRLLARAREMDVEDRIVLTGLVAPERIPAMLRTMDVLVHPSAREGLPRTVPQAMLSGVCPIATDIDGTPEICREMQTGRLVPEGDPRSLAEAVRWAYKHPDQRQRLAERGRAECMTTFDAETMIDALYAVYDQALRRRGMR